MKFIFVNFRHALRTSMYLLSLLKIWNFFFFYVSDESKLLKWQCKKNVGKNRRVYLILLIIEKYQRNVLPYILVLFCFVNLFVRFLFVFCLFVCLFVRFLFVFCLFVCFLLLLSLVILGVGGARGWIHYIAQVLINSWKKTHFV
jgi:hypothetical protein